jgi:outer membrane protein OmpA-like peptidoglycan-associated protein
MAVNLFELLQSSLGPTLTREASRYIGESDTTTRAAIGAVLPAVLAGVMQQGSTPSGAADLFRTLTGPRVETGLVGKLGGMLASGDKSVLTMGSTLTGALFGDRVGGLASAITSMSGMKTSSVNTLLAMAAPAVLSYLKGYLAQNKLDVGGLAGLLAGQREHIPSGLDDRITRALGFTGSTAFLSSLASGFAGQAAGAAGAVKGAARDASLGVARAGEAAYGAASDAVEHAPAVTPLLRSPWLWGAVAALALLAWVLFQNWSSAPGTAMKSLDLPGGAKIQVAAGGFLDSLNGFLSGTGAGEPKSFTIDDLRFETASAALTPDSSRQLAMLAAVLKAYPKATVSVRGHTDNAGDPDTNKKLSADRAAAVKQALVERGVPAPQIESEGHGSERPIASNESEEGRARNRRVELVVVKS